MIHVPNTVGKKTGETVQKHPTPVILLCSAYFFEISTSFPILLSSQVIRPFCLAFFVRFLKVRDCSHKSEYAPKQSAECDVADSHPSRRYVQRCLTSVIPPETLCIKHAIVRRWLTDTFLTASGDIL